MSYNLYKRVQNVVARNGSVRSSEGCKVCSSAELLLGRNGHLAVGTFFSDGK